MKRAWAGQGYPNQWLTYAFTEPTKVERYSIATGFGECPVAWTLEGSNEDTEDARWVIIDTVTGQVCHDREAVYYDIDTPGSFIRYKWVFTAGVGGNANGIIIREIKMSLGAP